MPACGIFMLNEVHTLRDECFGLSDDRREDVESAIALIEGDDRLKNKVPLGTALHFTSLSRSCLIPPPRPFGNPRELLVDDIEAFAEKAGYVDCGDNGSVSDLKIRVFLEILTPQEKAVIKARFLKDKSFKKIAFQMEISSSEVIRHYRCAIRKMRRKAKELGLKIN